MFAPFLIGDGEMRTTCIWTEAILSSGLWIEGFHDIEVPAIATQNLIHYALDRKRAQIS